MKAKYIHPLLLSVGFAGYCSAEAPDTKEQTAGKKPLNVVFILSDDHRYDYMGFMQTVPWLETPHMDRMAREGAHIKNAFVTTSLSSPSRASILTGMYSHAHKVVDNTAPLPTGLTFFPEYLQKAGYQTAFFGKWHMGNDSGDPQPGFHHWEGFRGQGEYYNPRINTNGEWIQYQDSTYVTDLLTEHAIDFMKKQQANNEQFFVYLSHKGVHDNFAAAKRHRDCYKDKELVLPPSFNTPHYGISELPTIDPATGKAASGKDYYGDNMIPDWVKSQRESWHGVDYSYHGRPWDVQVRRYCETLRSVDESIGSVLDYLKEAGLDENTLVIYMGDNGFAWGEHGLIDKRQFYEESVRVPMLARCPALFKGGLVVENMVQNVDIAPTIMDYLGLNKAEQMVGYSFIPLLKGEKPDWRERIFYEYYWEHEFPQTPTMHGVRTDQYKYIRYHGIWDTNEFYDLQKDPYEMQNLIASPEHQETIKQLNHALYDWLEGTDGMNIPLKRTERPHTDHRNIRNY
ncbi:N-acetylglucosamine-6-sulfatase [Parabacteroides sp. PF5-5]|uniref:sulfatase family protein n=1 Tax=unclassified Parabacteroides TaxID=2649774 RepID=UPI0024756824|nr:MULTISPECIES: sulfatase [unclassified Parabacteroides]MDH6305348.1 N-acetylglucosamine-6-sulfatase [Parabacteroides sp. PH5-39]MDH6316701.1 N-acetylglucosamine-6-sulfatase [Parabacteroides sp. PF5-13]MDH6320119.1 N-acetylglucosamine-6-sulfatase [Parabacteroides sp. PH5-13]MDH6323938.1 N-acetylglucosamine-6-sulfatase [Parabacteroides sp. PH5-8]MDH6327796.1 N-acetylglucosamine-6-sulfatase [Parabacteroides sp. PH5-41]